IVLSNQKLNVLRPSLGRNLPEIVMALPCLVPAGNHRIETVGSVVEIQDFTERGIACMVSLVGTEGKADDQGLFQRVRKRDQVEETGHDIGILIGGRTIRDQKEVAKVPFGWLQLDHGDITFRSRA